VTRIVTGFPEVTTPVSLRAQIVAILRYECQAGLGAGTLFSLKSWCEKCEIRYLQRKSDMAEARYKGRVQNADCKLKRSDGLGRVAGWRFGLGLAGHKTRVKGG